VTAMQALLLPVGDDFYALPVSWIREVVAAPALTPLVTAPDRVLGLFNLRGQIVPLLDTAALLGTGSIDTVAFAVVVNWDQGPTGLAVTAFPHRAELQEPAGPSDLPGTLGLFQVDEQIAALLDPVVLLAPVRLGAGESRMDPVPAGVA
jgi:chemotaxis signal transduction protein